MPVHSFARPAGRLDIFEIESEAAGRNLLGDPARRTVAVYLPTSYREGKGPYPVFVALAGFGGSGSSFLAWRAFGESLPQRVERLERQGALGPAVWVMPDCFTSLGGNQYIDSAAMGQWETFLCRDLLAAVEARYDVCQSARGRALFGKSSGGYGALVHGMRHADTWGAVACHAGDMAFDVCYLHDVRTAAALLDRREQTPAEFVDALRTSRRIAPQEFNVLMALAMAATYDPDPAAPYGIRLPVDPATGVLDEAAWARWVAHDPLTLIEQEGVQDNLRALHALLFDCGTRDEFLLHMGARRLASRLEALDIAHTYEEFDDGHRDTSYRYDWSLPRLYRTIAP